MSESFWQLNEFREIAPTFYTRTAEDRKGNLRKRPYSKRKMVMSSEKIAIKKRIEAMELHEMFSVDNITRRQGQTLVNNIYQQQLHQTGQRQTMIRVSSKMVQGHITFVRAR